MILLKNKVNSRKSKPIIYHSRIARVPTECQTIGDWNRKHKKSTVNNKKTRTPCFSTLRFPIYLRNRLSYKKSIYILSVFKELSAGTEIFQIR